MFDFFNDRISMIKYMAAFRHTSEFLNENESVDVFVKNATKSLIVDYSLPVLYSLRQKLSIPYVEAVTGSLLLFG